MLDVLLLLEVFEKFRNAIFEIHKLDQSSLITPFLAMQAALLKLKKKSTC